MREPLSPYKGAQALNYLCIIATELLGETHLRNIPTLVAGFDAILHKLSPNVAQAIRNVRLAGFAPWSMRELRLMVDGYREAHRRQAAERSRGRQAPLWSDDEEPSDGGSAAEERAASRRGPQEAMGLPEPSERFTIDDQFNVKRAWTYIMPEDIKDAIRSLTVPLPLRRRPQRVLHDPKSPAVVRNERIQFEAWIDPLDVVPPAPPQFDIQRIGRAPGSVRWDDLIAVADRFDDLDEKAGRQRAGERSWYRRLHTANGERTAVLLQAAESGLVPTDGMDLVGLKHLIGLPGAGKTTLLFLLAAWMDERGYRVCFLFPSIEVSTAFIEKLAQYSVRAGLLFGQSDRARSKHVANFASALSQDNSGFAVTRSAAPFFATNCALAGYASDEDVAFPHDRPPCQSVLQRAIDDKKKVKDANSQKPTRDRQRQCALASVCGRQFVERELVDATVWAGHVLSTDREVSPLFSGVQLRHFELIARTFDLVVVDECDGAQANLDGRGTPLMKLSGDANSVWNHLLMDLHAPAAQGRNAFVAGTTIPTIMAMSGRFGTAAERLTAAIIHASPQFRKETENKLLTSLSVLADMYPEPKEDDESAWAPDDMPDAVLRAHQDARQAMERIWDIVAKRVAFRERPELIADADELDRAEGVWSGTDDASIEVEALGWRDEGVDEKELAKLGQLAFCSADAVRSYLERLFQALDLWDRDGRDDSMRRLVDVLKDAPGLRNRRDDASFYEHAKLLANVTLLVLQHFGLAPHLRLLNAQGILGDDVFESRPSRELLALVPEALVGRLSGVRFTMGDEGDVDIAHVGFAGTPRLLVRRMVQLGNEGGSGPAVLLTSATSMLEQSPSYHVNVGPHYVLQRPNAGTGWLNSRYSFLPLKDPADERRLLYFSGSKMSRREHVLKSMVDRLLADGVLGTVETAIRQSDVVDGVGRKAAFVVNSYDQCELLYEHIRTHHPSWRPRVRYLVRGGAAGAMPEHGITASEVERLGDDQEWDLFIFPMNAIGRGVNIVFKFGPRADKAMIGSLFFLTRPHPRADSLSFLQGIIGRASEAYDTSVFSSRKEAVEALRQQRGQVSGVISHLLRMPQAAKALGPHAKAFVADQMIMIIQTIGRTMRGDCPAFVHFVDAAWAPRSASGAIDNARSSMLLMMREILAECLAHPDAAARECYENLYRSFSIPLSNIEGVITE